MENDNAVGGLAAALADFYAGAGFRATPIGPQFDHDVLGVPTGDLKVVERSVEAEGKLFANVDVRLGSEKLANAVEVAGGEGSEKRVRVCLQSIDHLTVRLGKAENLGGVVLGATLAAPGQADEYDGEKPQPAFHGEGDRHDR